ncbi:MAG: N-acetylglutaminylglutamine amidotransferase [Candidatus Competibacterales bacterium]
MCGIAGELRFDGRDGDIVTLSRMIQVLHPRGPDGNGVFAQGRYAFGQCRLKIMDLSEHAQQPMVDNHLGLGITFNGAIYNHPELRAELRQKGYRFYSTGDTEVILKAYHAWGFDCVQHFHGMFAFALWERDSGRVILARDRLGIKPLYYSLDSKRLRLASTLPALLQGGDVDTTIDPVALNYYMNFHAVVPAPHTMVKGVAKLPPATVMVVEADGKCHSQRYWTLNFDAHPPFSDEGEWREALLQALRTAVARRLVSDEPVGALLSGGVDSSLIVGLMVEAGASKLRTYSIGFEDVGREKGNEFSYSDIVAQHFQTDHQQIFIDSQRLLPALPHAIAAMSEPMVSHDCVAFYLLAEAVSQHSKVVQSGQGADEVFGGYHWYPPLLDTNDPVLSYARVFKDRDFDEYREAVCAPWVERDYALAFIDDHFAKPGATDAVDKALRLDTTVMLVDDPVKRVDNMTMAFGLEARVPFLDHELVELAATMPAALKVRGEGKYILKEAARAVIPSRVIDRPKGYFPVPALKYLQGDYLTYVGDLLNSDAARQRGIFNSDYVAKLMEDPEAHITPLRGSKLWQIALLEAWCQTHGL